MHLHLRRWEENAWSRNNVHPLTLASSQLRPFSIFEALKHDLRFTLDKFILYILSICLLLEQANIFVGSIHPQALVCPTSSKRLIFLADRIGDMLAIEGPRNKGQLNADTEAYGVLTME